MSRLLLNPQPQNQFITIIWPGSIVKWKDSDDQLWIVLSRVTVTSSTQYMIRSIPQEDGSFVTRTREPGELTIVLSGSPFIKDVKGTSSVYEYKKN